MKTTLSAADLLARDLASLVHPLHDPKAHQAGHVWLRGHDAMLIDADGKEYIDGLSGLWNVAVGHGRRELAEAAREQLETLAYASGYCGSSNVRAIELGERLARLTYPAINRFFFTSGGAEANESAIKIARSYWKLRGKPGKTKVISRENAYHGLTLAAMSATGIAGYWPLFEPRVPGFVHISGAIADELEKAILREGAETVAMFLAEPVQGVGGVIVPPDEYFPRIREICDRYDVLFAADEVITGFGRTGKWFALEHWGVAPDMVQFAKAITSGYFPLGGVGISDEIARVLDEAPAPWMHAYTYSAHPAGCAVALRNLQIIEDENLVAEASRKGGYLMDVLRTHLASHPHVGEIRGKGFMCAVEFVKDRETKTAFAPEEQVGARIHAEAQKRGLFSRVRGDVFVLAPPFVTPDDLLDRIGEILRSATTSVLAISIAIAILATGVFAQNAAPKFRVDPDWPKIPNNWQFGQVASVSVDGDDHVWVLQRPGTLGANEKGRAAPPVIEFTADGSFVRAWGGPASGYEWPSSEHGIYVDPKGFVWIGGNGDKDHQILKFTKEGTFVMQIGRAGQSRGNADTDNLNQPADTFVHAATNELFVADGYGNRRVIVFDADSGRFKRMWGAFGNMPTDAAPNPASADAEPRGAPQFVQPVHAARVSRDGLVYVSDRGGKRVQVFTLDGTYVTQVFIGRECKAPDCGNGTTAASTAFSSDGEQRFLYVGNRSQAKVMVFDRRGLQLLDSFGEWGSAPGQFGTLHHMAADSKGNLYVTEVTPLRPENRRVQKFVIATR